MGGGGGGVEGGGGGVAAIEQETDLPSRKITLDNAIKCSKLGSETIHLLLVGPLLF